MCRKIGSIVKVQGAVCSCVKLRCKSWSCEDCSKMRKMRLVAEAKEGKPERFITLTVNPSWFSSPEERATKMVEAWRLIRRRFLKLRKNNVCEFLAVFELTKLGEPHLHIIQRGSYMSQKWLSAQMLELMGAPIVDIRTVRGKKEVARYVTKYISKRNIKIGTLKRYWRSLKYLKVSRAELRRQRNAGATFYQLDCHWKTYLSWIQCYHEEDILFIGKHGFEFEWWEDREPPWVVTAEALGAPRREPECPF